MILSINTLYSHRTYYMVIEADTIIESGQIQHPATKPAHKQSAIMKELKCIFDKYPADTVMVNPGDTLKVRSVHESLKNLEIPFTITT